MQRAFLATLFAAGSILLGDCLCSVRLCSPSTCPGCCDVFDVCQAGTADGTCGTSGASCHDCSTTGRFCVSSECRAPTAGADAGACHGGCSAPATLCVGGTGYETCVQFTPTCWDWVFSGCPAGSNCQGGACVLPDGGCVSECPTAGATRCVAPGAYEKCLTNPASGCFVWTAPIACAANAVCNDPPGVCQTSGPDAGVATDGGAAPDGGCANCAPGATQCSGTGVTTCTFDGQCWNWGPAETCAAGSVCSGGACQCASNCSVPYSSDCVGTAIEVCAPTDAGCLVLQQGSCGGSYTCQGGRCVTTPVVNVGGGCTTDSDCGGPAGYASCIPDWPQGYCVMGCSGFYYCPTGSTCFIVGRQPDGGDIQACLADCSSPLAGQSTCRGEYVCEDYGASDPNNPGPVGTCVPNCNWFQATAADAGGAGAFCQTGTGPDGGPYCQASGYCR